jgi:phage shock protein C
MSEMFVYSRLIVFGLVLLVPLVLLILLVVVLARGSASRHPSTSAPSQGPPPPSMDQRSVSLQRSLSRYKEERSRILAMLENGTISPEEADRLFATLDRETSTMACPYCGGAVRIEAIRCKHCRRDLVAGVGRKRRLRKSRDRMLAGVCGGLAEYSGLDVSLLRLLIAFVVLASGIITGLIVYLVAALILPDPE